MLCQAQEQERWWRCVELGHCRSVEPEDAVAERIVRGVAGASSNTRESWGLSWQVVLVVYVVFVCRSF